MCMSEQSVSLSGARWFGASGSKQAIPCSVANRHCLLCAPRCCPPLGGLSVQEEEDEEPPLPPSEGWEAPPKLRTTAEEPGRASGMSSHCGGVGGAHKKGVRSSQYISIHGVHCLRAGTSCRVPISIQPHCFPHTNHPHLLLHAAECAAAVEAGGLDAVVQAPVAVAAHAHAAAAEVDAL